ncbi:unknown protein [Seminavis robusta]|uniref:Transmembrane protein n=1 Tax=Seminavis robusta TaxID=568900 RepID=A0A9N8HA01_9STRA|nr:unknown protein [Seminavis robusta]|eukprot:Sro132_g062580.1 n/a (338) ;mRNA; f:53895-54985
MTGVSGWKKQLFTKEDSIYLHKTLGMLCLVSFVWRIVQVDGITMKHSDMGFVSHPKLTVPTILLHLFLSTSSFIFRIPERRIKTGYRIWPEYRLHSLVFLCRSLAFPLLQYYENLNGLPPNYLWNVAIVLSSVMVADIASASMKYPSGTIRGFQTNKLLKFFFSAVQFHATAACLYGGTSAVTRRSGVLWIHTFVIQMNAFLMTLRRKNLLSHEAGIAAYAWMLGAGFLIVVWLHVMEASKGMQTIHAITLTANVAAMLRLGLGMNKYVMWTMMGIVVNLVIRPIMQGQSNGVVSKEMLNMADPISTAALLFLGFYKAGMLPQLSMVFQRISSKKEA